MNQRHSLLSVTLYSMGIGCLLLLFLGAWTLVGRMVTAQDNTQAALGFVAGIGLLGVTGATGTALTKWFNNFLKEKDNEAADKGSRNADSGGDSK